MYAVEGSCRMLVEPCDSFRLNWETLGCSPTILFWREGGGDMIVITIGRVKSKFVRSGDFGWMARGWRGGSL